MLNRLSQYHTLNEIDGIYISCILSFSYKNRRGNLHISYYNAQIVMSRSYLCPPEKKKIKERKKENVGKNTSHLRGYSGE